MEFKPGVRTAAEYKARRDRCTQEQLERLLHSQEHAAWAVKQVHTGNAVHAWTRKHAWFLVVALILLSTMGSGLGFVHFKASPIKQHAAEELQQAAPLIFPTQPQHLDQPQSEDADELPHLLSQGSKDKLDLNSDTQTTANSISDAPWSEHHLERSDPDTFSLSNAFHDAQQKQLDALVSMFKRGLLRLPADVIANQQSGNFIVAADPAPLDTSISAPVETATSEHQPQLQAPPVSPWQHVSTSDICTRRDDRQRVYGKRQDAAFEIDSNESLRKIFLQRAARPVTRADQYFAGMVLAVVLMGVAKFVFEVLASLLHCIKSVVQCVMSLPSSLKALRQRLASICCRKSDVGRADSCTTGLALAAHQGKNLVLLRVGAGVSAEPETPPSKEKATLQREVSSLSGGSTPGTPSMLSAGSYFGPAPTPSAHPQSEGSAVLSSQSSMPDHDVPVDCTTPFGQIRPTGMMSTPPQAPPLASAPLVRQSTLDATAIQADAAPESSQSQHVATSQTAKGSVPPPPAPPPPPSRPLRASSVPVPPPPPAPRTMTPGSRLKAQGTRGPAGVPTPPPPPGMRGVVGVPTPPPPPGFASAQGKAAPASVQTPENALVPVGQPGAFIHTREVPSKGRQNWQKLKKLHWEQIKGTRKGFWLRVNAGAANINYERLAERFKVVARSMTRVEVPKSSIIALLDRQRSMNLAIPLKKLKLSPSEIKAALMTLDAKGLDVENLEALAKAVPTDDECSTVKLFLAGKHHSHPGINDVQKLDAAGQYCAEVVCIPNLSQRISSLIFVHHFEATVDMVKGQLDMVHTACVEVQTSCQLKELLGAVLDAGNFLNGSVNGNAIAFKLATLLKLTDLKDDNKRSLLHFVIDELLERESISDKLLHQLAATPRAAAIQMSGVGKVIGEQEGALRVLHKVLLQPADAQQAEADPALADLRRFYQNAGSALTALRAQYGAVSRELEQLSAHFMEAHDAGQPEQLLCTLKAFILLFSKTLVEVKAVRAKAQEEEVRKQRSAAGQPHRSASLPPPDLHTLQKAHLQKRAARLLHTRQAPPQQDSSAQSPAQPAHTSEQSQSAEAPEQSQSAGDGETMRPAESAEYVPFWQAAQARGLTAPTQASEAAQPSQASKASQASV